MTDSTGSPTLLPLTAAQQGIWNAQKLDPTSPYYVVGEVLELGRVDTCLLAQAVALTVDESETLRLRFLEDADGADGPRQYVDHSPAEFPEIRDISGAPDPELLATAIIDAEKVECGSAWCGMTSPDAGPSNPLHRFLILDLGDAVWCVQLYHHIIVDGYSAALLTRRTAAHYTELAGGRKARPAKFATMAEIVASDLEYRDSDVTARTATSGATTSPRPLTPPDARTWSTVPEPRASPPRCDWTARRWPSCVPGRSPTAWCGRTWCSAPTVPGCASSESPGRTRLRH